MENCWGGRRRAHSLLAVASLLAPLALALLALPAAALTSHGVILIEGNGDFTAAHGITGGSGSASDPFIVEGFDIVPDARPGIKIWNTTSYVEFRNISIHDGPTQHGIEVVSASHVTFRNVTIRNVVNGALLQWSTEITFEASNLSRLTYRGIECVSSNHIIVANSTLSGNTDLDVNVDIYSNNVTLRGNTLAKAGPAKSGTWAVYAVESSTPRPPKSYIGVVLENNTFRNEGVYMNKNNAWFINNTFLGVGIQFGYAHNQELHGNSFVNTTFGVPAGYAYRDIVADPLPWGEIFYADSYTITPDNLIDGQPIRFYSMCDNLTVDGVSAGLVIVWNCRDVLVTNLSMDTNAGGVQLDGVSRGAVVGNHVVGGTGIGLWGADHVVVAANTVEAASVGIGASYSNNVSVTRNRVVGSQYTGIAASLARDVLITENHVEGKGGPQIGAQMTTRLSVHTNNIIGSGELARADTSVRPIDTQFDGGYPTGGNYWSNYTGVDQCSGAAQDVCTGGDGFGDDPQPVPSAFNDNYPLMAPLNLSVSTTIAAVQASPTVIFGGQNVTFDASGSRDVLGAGVGLEYRFDFDGDGAWETGWGAQPRATNAYAAPGNWTAVVEVRSGSGSTDQAFVHVRAVPFAVNVSFLGPASPPVAGAGFAVRLQIVSEVTPSRVTVSYSTGNGTSAGSVAALAQPDGTYLASLPAFEAPGPATLSAVVEFEGEPSVHAPGNDTWSLAVAPAPPDARQPNPLSSPLVPAVLVTVAVAGAVLGAAAFTEFGRYALGALLVSALFPRLRKDTLMTHFVRGRLYQAISKQPGIHFSELRREADVSSGTATHHLHILEKAGYIKSKREGALVRFYTTGQPIKDEEYGLLDEERDVLEEVRANPGLPEEAIATRLDQHPAAVKRSVARLKRLGFLESAPGAGGQPLVARKPPEP